MKHNFLVPRLSQPRSVFNSLNDFDDLFSQFWGAKNPLMNDESDVKYFTPAIDIHETDAEFQMSVDLPGLKKDDVKIELNGRNLTLSGVRQYENKEQSEGYSRREKFYGEFRRSFTLPENINTEDIKAQMQNGVLELRLPKHEVARSKTVAIS